MAEINVEHYGQICRPVCLPSCGWTPRALCLASIVANISYIPYQKKSRFKALLSSGIQWSILFGSCWSSTSDWLLWLVFSFKTFIGQCHLYHYFALIKYIYVYIKKRFGWSNDALSILAQGIRSFVFQWSFGYI